MSKIKTLLCEDREQGKIIRYSCTKRNVSDIEAEYCFSSLYGMKLTSSTVNTNALKTGNGTNDLIRELRAIFDDEYSSVIDFGNVLNLFNMNKVTPCVIMESVKKLLGMYEVEKVSEYSKGEWLEKIEEKISSKDCETLSLQRRKEELRSIEANTEALQNINLKKYTKRK